MTNPNICIICQRERIKHKEHEKCGDKKCVTCEDIFYKCTTCEKYSCKFCTTGTENDGYDCIKCSF